MSILAAITGMGAIGGILGKIGGLAKDIRSAITGEISPEKKAEIDKQLLELESAATMGQLRVNEAEAQHASIFVAGWRPFIGWICGFALLYHYIASPTIEWVIRTQGLDITRPTIDIRDLMVILTGMLGLGIMRTREKEKGVHGNH